MTAPIQDARTQVISFVLFPEMMGLPLHYVEKVVEAGELSFIPRVPSFIRGALNQQGKIVAVLDLRDFLGMSSAEITSDSRILILASQVFHLGFLVDRVERIESVPLKGHLVQSPEADSLPYISKIINLGGRILNLLDVDKLLGEIENYFI